MTNHGRNHNMPARDQGQTKSIRLADGRQLAWRTFGDPAGRPLLGFHGTPGSSLMLDFMDEAARQHGFHLIAPDRPGLGRSDPKPGRRLVDWPEDVRALLDALQIERAAVVGISGGGPYALASAVQLASRVGQVLLASSMGPTAGPEATPNLPLAYRGVLGLGERVPGLVRFMFKIDGFGWRHASKLLNMRMIAASPAPDRKVLRTRAFQRSLRFAIQEGFRQGGSAPADDLELLTGPWGFSLRAVTCPVVLWHGELDRLTPIQMARHMANLLPDCRPHITTNAGHFFTFERPGELLRSLLEVSG